MIKDNELRIFRHQLKRLGFEGIDDKLLSLYYDAVFSSKKAMKEWPDTLNVSRILANVLLYLHMLAHMGKFRSAHAFRGIFEDVVLHGVEDIKHVHLMTEEEKESMWIKQSLIAQSQQHDN